MTDDRWETVWTFYTKHYAVRLAVTDEDQSPEDQFSEPDDVLFASEGGWHWFRARVQVVYHDINNTRKWAVTRARVLGEDYLGGCSYHDLNDFRSSGYFRNMVSEAITEARQNIERMCSTARKIA